MKDILIYIAVSVITLLIFLAYESRADEHDIYTVYVWNDTPYDGNPIVVGKFANCEQGHAMVENMYPDAKAMHCITADLTPPGGIKK